MNPGYKLFILPTSISILLLAGVFIYLGLAAFLTALLLVILEVTLSFDNAVVNAKVLKDMDAKWQQRFLTWGILIAVVGTRLILPIIIVSLSVWLSPIVITKLAFFDPAGYGALLEGAHHSISAFGGAFLLMVALKFFFDAGKEIHWLGAIEKRIARWGSIESVEIALSLLIFAGIAFLAPEEAATILLSGIFGIVTFVVIDGIANAFAMEGPAHGSGAAAGTAAASGLALFAYLNVLDAAFSLDGVIGAFAVTTALPIIIIGLGVGAYFVRTLTVFLVRQKTLGTLIYIEHGAHWAILGLAGSMLVSLFVHVPEAVVGLIGIVFVAASIYASILERNKARRKGIAQ